MTSTEKNIKFKTITQTIINAAAKASEQLKQKKPPPSILVVENENNSTLSVASYNGISHEQRRLPSLTSCFFR